MWLHLKMDKIPKQFTDDVLNHFWTWPDFTDFQKSYCYLAMEAIEKSESVKRGALSEKAELIT